MSDIVERLRGTRRVSQHDSAGRLIQFDGEPTPLELEAADEISRLRSLTTWRPIDDQAKSGEEILAANDQYAGGNPAVVSFENDAKFPWEAEGCRYHHDAFTHYRPLGPGPGDIPPPPETKT